MEGGVIVLLDALGVKNAYRREPTEVLQRRWNFVDRRLIRLMNIINRKLKANSYNYSVRIQQPYDNVQIFLPFDTTSHKYTYISPRTPEWYSVQHIGELLIPFFRYALYHKIHFRGCISAGEYFLTRKRVFGPAVDESAVYCENANWLGIMTSRTVKVLDAPDTYTLTWFRIFTRKENHSSNSERKIRSWALKWNIPRHGYLVDKRVTNKKIERILNSEISNAKRNLQALSNKNNRNSRKFQELTQIDKKWVNTLDFFRRTVQTWFVSSSIAKS